MKNRFLYLLFLAVALFTACSPQPGETPPVATPLATVLLADLERETAVAVSPTSLPALPPATEIPATPIPTSIPPTATAIPDQLVGEFWLRPDAVWPPADYAELFLAAVAAGEMRYEQGLVAVLQIIAGEATLKEHFGDVVLAHYEANYAVALAREYLQNGSDTAAQAEINRLLAILAPDPERLLAYAVPQPTGQSQINSSKAIIASKLASADPVQCRELWQEGFPAGSNVICLQYAERALGSGVSRVFYPAYWWPSDQKLAFANAAMEALADSAAVYSQYGPIYSMDLVFSQLDYSLNTADEVAAAIAMGQQNSCQIVVFPLSLKSSYELGIDSFKQAIAHEVFHCFQAWHIPAETNGSPAANTWWAEGSAEFFSNVVYPATNNEWQFIDSFDARSATTPIYQMGYENTIFFQYLANTIGVTGLMDLLQSLPGKTTPEETAAALAAYPDMENLFHDFARAFMDRNIADTSGVLLPIKGTLAPGYHITINKDASAALATAPFVLSRYQFTFAAQNLFNVSLNSSGGPGLESARPGYTRGETWGAMPGLVGAGCQEQYYTLVSTTTAMGSPARVTDLTATHEKDTACDQCLVGTWELDLVYYADALLSDLFEDDDVSYRLNDITGNIRLQFTDSGYFQNMYQDFTVDTSMLMKNSAGGTFATALVMITSGTAGGSYWLDTESNLLLMVRTASTVVRQMRIDNSGGTLRPVFTNLGHVGDGRTYTCTATELITHTVDADGQPSQNIYMRIRE